MERILVINDDPGSQQAMRRVLGGAGYDATIVPSDQIVMDVIRATKAGLVLLDVSLPGRSTQDICRQIREKFKNVPILVLSAISDVEEVILLLKIGADDYIIKPFDPLEFLARIRAAMRRRENY